MNKWAVSVHGEASESWEVCAEKLPHMLSWGWYGRHKIHMEGMKFEEAQIIASVICEALNAFESAKGVE